MVETISRESLAWLAGIIDGEGSIMLEKTGNGKRFYTYRCSVKIGNNDPFMIQKISQLYEAMGLKFCFTLNIKNNNSLYINAYGFGTIKKLLEMIAPYLVSKKEQAAVVLDFISQRNTMQDKIKKRNPEVLVQYLGLQTIAREKLQELHKKTWPLQRLQRTAHRSLNLISILAA